MKKFLQMVSTRVCVYQCKSALFVFGVLLAVSQIQAAGGSEWPQWRGVNRDDLSMETGLLKQWPEGGPTLAWKATGLGTHPVVVNGKLYIRDQNRLLCYDVM